MRAIRSAVALFCATAIVLLPAVPASADEVRDGQWHLRYLKVNEAHKLTQGQGVTVAVLDTGVERHPDLRKNLLAGKNFSSSSSALDGRKDDDGHGTAMAGLVAAHGRGGQQGSLGIAPRAKILPVRNGDLLGEGNAPDSEIDDATAEGLAWAVAKGADVISISSTGGSSPRLREAVALAIESDVIVVAGVGNRPMHSLIGFPALIEGVVAVGATDRNGNHAEVSVTGKELDLVAPGVDVLAPTKGGQYSGGTGTSNSTAIVSGAAALVRSRFPDLSAEEVVHRLTYTAVDKGAPGRDEEYGYGVLDLMAALTADVPPLEASPTPSSSASPSPSTGGVASPEDDPAGGSSGLRTTLAVLAVAGLGIVFLVFGYRRHRKKLAP